MRLESFKCKHCSSPTTISIPVELKGTQHGIQNHFNDIYGNVRGGLAVAKDVDMGTKPVFLCKDCIKSFIEKKYLPLYADFLFFPLVFVLLIVSCTMGVFSSAKFICCIALALLVVHYIYIQELKKEISIGRKRDHNLHLPFLHLSNKELVITFLPAVLFIVTIFMPVRAWKTYIIILTIFYCSTIAWNYIQYLKYDMICKHPEKNKEIIAKAVTHYLDLDDNIRLYKRDLSLSPASKETVKCI